jgi:2-polyprenyl-3-methyl-5-hydroxy-6-metoxy-1,4-benzoquinol methylase
VDCCEPDLYDTQFDVKHARDRLREYRRNGPKGWTARLIEELSRGGVDGLTVLDIGAGVGAVHQALLAAGASTATDVDASGPYIAAAKEEAERRGVGDRVSYVKGDAVAVGADVAEADLVALDRVVCCYVDMDALVRMASTHTRRRLGMVLPKDSRWIRTGVALSNRWSGFRGDPFRFYVHPTDAVLAVAREAGLEPVSVHGGFFWQTLVLERRPA